MTDNPQIPFILQFEELGEEEARSGSSGLLFFESSFHGLTEKSPFLPWDFPSRISKL